MLEYMIIIGIINDISIALNNNIKEKKRQGKE